MEHTILTVITNGLLLMKLFIIFLPHGSCISPITDLENHSKYVEGDHPRYKEKF